MEQKYKTGLILEGGAMLGLFSAGVLDVFMENGIRFDGAIGISAGAVFGCNYKSRQIGRAIRYNKKYGKDKRYCSLRSLLLTGDLYGVKFCYDELPNKLDVFDADTFANDPTEFYVGATDAETGRAVYHRCTDGKRRDMRWIRASGSMPILSRPVKIGGRELLDGGMSDSIPFEFMERHGYNRNVIILTKPDGYRKKPMRGSPLIKLCLRKHKGAAEALLERSKMYNRQLEGVKEREEAGISLVIRPSESLGISRTENDPEKLERVYQTGRRTALEKLPEVIAFLRGEDPCRERSDK